MMIFEFNVEFFSIQSIFFNENESSTICRKKITAKGFIVFMKYIHLSIQERIQDFTNGGD